MASHEIGLDPRTIPLAHHRLYHLVRDHGLDRILGQGNRVDDLRDIVLDPFAGSGTTLQVARRLGRRSIGIELSQESVAYMGEKLARPQVASLMGFDTPVEE